MKHVKKIYSTASYSHTTLGQAFLCRHTACSTNQFQLASALVLASGLRISRANGDPGAGSAIRIRGANTILGASDPLIIVDGSPLNNQTSYGCLIDQKLFFVI